MLAQISRLVQQRCGDILRVLDAAAAHPDVAAAAAESARRQRLGAEAILSQVESAGALAEGLALARATDIAVALMSSQVCQSLVTRSDWSSDEYQTWLAATLVATLLVPRGPVPADTTV